MVIKNRDELLTKFRKILENSEPFIGNDESWKVLYDNKWESKRKEYLDLCKTKVEKLREKYLPFQ